MTLLTRCLKNMIKTCENICRRQQLPLPSLPPGCRRGTFDARLPAMTLGRQPPLPQSWARLTWPRGHRRPAPARSPAGSGPPPRATPRTRDDAAQHLKPSSWEGPRGQGSPPRTRSQDVRGPAAQLDGAVTNRSRGRAAGSPPWTGSAHRPQDLPPAAQRPQRGQIGAVLGTASRHIRAAVR